MDLSFPCPWCTTEMSIDCAPSARWQCRTTCDDCGRHVVVTVSGDRVLIARGPWTPSAVDGDAHPFPSPSAGGTGVSSPRA